jgi:acetyl esterase/lipase
MKPIFAILFLICANHTYSQSMKINLWPDGNIPLSIKNILQEQIESTDMVRIGKVQVPQIEVYLPNKKSTTGQAVIICPGGGYSILAYDWEGTDIAKLLNAKGIAAFVLKYRLPDPLSSTAPDRVPLMDAQQALRIVRARAAEWNIMPNKIGIMGFSAGGHLASTLSTHFEEDSKPNFSILIYPVISMDKNITHTGSRNNLIGNNPSDVMIKLYSNELQVTTNTPPTFLIHATDDDVVPVENSLLYYQALKKNKVSTEMHIYPAGGHGFGLANGNKSLETWSNLLIEWMRGLNK